MKPEFKEKKIPAAIGGPVLFLALIFIFLQYIGKAQKTEQKFQAGTGVEAFISFNGHGPFLSGYLSLNSDAHSFKVGPLLQTRTSKINGLKLSYSYTLAKRERLILADEVRSVNGPLRLGLFSFLQYVHKGGLSNARATQERTMNPENLTDWTAVKLSTAEAGAGFELNIRLSRRLYLRNFMGISVYYHPDHPEGMYHEQSAPTLIFGTGLNIPRF